MTYKILESLVDETTFDEGDPLDEELENPQGIKEIASAITGMTLLKPMDYLTTIKELMAQVMAP